MTKCCFGIKFRYLWTLFKLVRYNMPLFKRNICSKEQLDPSNYFATLQLCVQPTNHISYSIHHNSHTSCRRRFWHATHDCIAPYVDIVLHRGRFWAKSAALGSVRWCCFRSCWTVLSHVMRGRPSCLLQSAGGEANRILLASALSSMCIICPNRVSRRDWIIAVSLGCCVSLRTSSFCTNWYHLMPSSIRRHYWSSASIFACVSLRYRPAVRTIKKYYRA